MVNPFWAFVSITCIGLDDNICLNIYNVLLSSNIIQEESFVMFQMLLLGICFEFLNTIGVLLLLKRFCMLFQM